MKTRWNGEKIKNGILLAVSLILVAGIFFYNIIGYKITIKEKSRRLGTHGSCDTYSSEGVGYSRVEALRTIFLFGVSLVFATSLSTDEITLSS